MHEIHVWEKLLVLVSYNYARCKKRFQLFVNPNSNIMKTIRLKLMFLKKKKHFHTVGNKGTEADIGVVSF